MHYSTGSDLYSIPTTVQIQIKLLVEIKEHQQCGLTPICGRVDRLILIAPRHENINDRDVLILLYLSEGLWLQKVDIVECDH